MTRRECVGPHLKCNIREIVNRARFAQIPEQTIDRLSYCQHSGDHSKVGVHLGPVFGARARTLPCPLLGNEDAKHRSANTHNTHEVGSAVDLKNWVFEEMRKLKFETIFKLCNYFHV